MSKHRVTKLRNAHVKNLEKSTYLKQTIFFFTLNFNGDWTNRIEMYQTKVSASNIYRLFHKPRKLI